jgi:hypothetical protein
MNNLETDFENWQKNIRALIELKRLLYKYSDEIIEDLQLEGAISCPDCIIGNCESCCYRYCCGCCQCNHNECDNCDMTCHSYPKLNKKDVKCSCNCDHADCDTNDTEENEEYCDGSCHESCKYLQFIKGDKVVVAMLLKEALCINDEIFNKYNDLLNSNDKYFEKPYKFTLSQYYTD